LLTCKIFISINKKEHSWSTIDMSYLDKVLKELYDARIKDVSKMQKISFSDAQKTGIKKVAFDIYKVMNDQYDGLWKVEEVDGTKFLVRASDPQYQTKDDGSWSAVSSYDGRNVTLSYKNVPICKFESDSFGFTPNDVFTFKSAVLEEVKENPDFLKGVFGSQPKLKTEAITNVFPELKKFV